MTFVNVHAKTASYLLLVKLVS